MAEFTFVGLAVLVWVFIIATVVATIGTLVLMVHVVRIETRYFLRKRRVKQAKREMLERQARTRRAKEEKAKNERFFADIQEITHGL